MPNFKDPFGSMQGFVNQFRGAMQNPQQMIMGRLGIPQNLANNPNGAIQWLMDSGKLTQDGYNQVRNMVNQIQNNQQFQRFMGSNTGKG